MTAQKNARKPRLAVVSEDSGVRPMPRAPREPKVQGPLGVVEQVKQALKPKARLAACLGFLLGGFVPLASYVVAHFEVDTNAPLYSQLSTLLVLGGLVFSARTVYDWARLAFNASGKALGFVVLAEGVMCTSHTPWLAVSALVYLVCINGIATGCTLSLRK
jgi:hypothetical protein